MYQAAICENETDVMRHIRDALAEGFDKRNMQIAFDLFTDGDSFIKTYENHHHYDIIFMDIEMPGTDGIAVCRQVRSITPQALIVFISNKEELVFQSIEVQPFRFIRKSEFHTLLPSLVESLQSELLKTNPRIIRITEPYSYDVLSFDANLIVYVEAQRKECLICTESDRTLVRSPFHLLEEKLMHYGFIKIHRSYIVNSRYISRITRNAVLLTTNEELPLSRSLAEKVKQAFIESAMRK